MSQADKEALYNKIVLASFIHAKKYGFTDEAIAAACDDFNLPAVTAGILSDGPLEVVRFAQDHWIKALKEDLQEYSEYSEEDKKDVNF